MATHTPGPWRIGGERRETEGISWAYFSSQRDIYPPAAKPGEEQHAGPIACVSTAEGTGNVRLIAAAPDLLEACRISGVVEVLDRIGNHAAARLFEAAIRKATGQN
jgi:hypothetical protein